MTNHTLKVGDTVRMGEPDTLSGGDLWTINRIEVRVSDNTPLFFLEHPSGLKLTACRDAAGRDVPGFSIQLDSTIRLSVETCLTAIAQ
jgi:hypothetical protein